MTRNVPVTEARKDLAELVNQVAYQGERVVLTRHGKAMAAIVSAADLELLERLLAERIDLTQAGAGRPVPAAETEPRPLRIAAEHRPPGPPRPPGFGR
ncbi:type II toxin-antitoxin system Phd/YefM family antitoxin [Actinomadura craniellae]|uniref:Antitoxin n=1 Tax=Actinomadura craniellae TaxID=2231787 RepID=A0A365H4T8_9ACTN|nr:type II toxin-antitoxin system Phd/YefM family antitoxin [Actinomadura craniellae]RAY14012.1 type II toxin-antitoxin system Phd/YefM family antitoxin [Actinomadura craniellae]